MIKKKRNYQSEKRFKLRNNHRKKQFSIRLYYLLLSFFHYFNQSSKSSLSTAQFGNKFTSNKRLGFGQGNRDYITSRHIILIILFSVSIIIVLFLKISLMNCSISIFSKYCQTRSAEIKKVAKLVNKIVIYKTPRNSIVDRNGKILAMDIFQYYLVLNPLKIYSSFNENTKNPENNCQIEPFYQEIKDSLTKNIPNLASFKQYITKYRTSKYKRVGKVGFKRKNELSKKLRNVSVADKKINYFKCKFVLLNESYYQRKYPKKEELSTLLGFVSLYRADKKKQIPIGQKGIERRFESELAVGYSYQKIIRSRKTGQVAEVFKFKEHQKSAKPLKLSLDVVMQKIIYEQIKEKVDSLKAKRGAALLIDGNNGEVLASVSYPSFNPDDLKSAISELRIDNVYQNNINPGSTMKPFILAAAIEKGVIPDNFKVDTNNEKIISNGIRVVDSEKRGVLTSNEVVIYSSNIGIIKIIRLIKKDDFAQYILNLNLAGNKVFGLAAEGKGSLKSPINWSNDYYDFLATGYSLTTTLVHLVRAYSVFVNDGRMVELSLLKRKKGEVIQQTQIFKKETIQKMLPVLRKVVEEGTAKKAQVKGYDVYGKTGTSQILVNGKYSKRKYRALFIGFLPTKKHRYILGIYIDEPKGYNYYGGSVAAPVFADSMKKILKIY